MINYILFLLVLFVANTIQTITGFAGNLLAMPPSMLLVGFDTSRTVINVFTLIACCYITYKNRKHTNWSIVKKMSVVMLAGMFIGNLLLKYFDLQILKYLYGILILAIAFKKLFFKKEFQIPHTLMALVLLCGGILHGLFLSGGALAVVYAEAKVKNKDEFRATIAPLWVVLDTILVAVHFKAGLYTKNNIWLIVLSVVPLFLSMYIGNKIYDIISQKVFLNLTYILLLVAGVLSFL